ncbi:MAG: OmpH family outer membrane protein [Planctomycetota bacterium]|nr:OmpH family outer membrane protein [Planctomycetota bacterium]MDA1025977.1 OmpH family outer membrane protein [Planctomycetota bacterium]
MSVDRSPSTHRLSRLAAPTALAVSLVLLVHTMSVNASRPTTVQADPTSVAVVEVSRVLDQIDEKSEWEIRIDALKSAIQQEGVSRQQAMERRLAESEAATSPEQRQDIRDEVALMQLRLEQWANMKAVEVDREQSLMWRSIYRNLRREAERVAEAEGYALVLVDDSGGEIRTQSGTQVPLQTQVLQQITSRRILFAANITDISDQIIVRMNNAVVAP